MVFLLALTGGGRGRREGDHISNGLPKIDRGGYMNSFANERQGIEGRVKIEEVLMFPPLLQVFACIDKQDDLPPAWIKIPRESRPWCTSVERQRTSGSSTPKPLCVYVSLLVVPPPVQTPYPRANGTTRHQINNNVVTRNDMPTDPGDNIARTPTVPRHEGTVPAANALLSFAREIGLPSTAIQPDLPSALDRRRI